MITTTDPIADMLTRIRNAIIVGKNEINLPHSKAKEAVAKVLVGAGFIESAKAQDNDGKKTLVILLSQAGQNAAINHVARVSRPGRRTYVTATKIPTIKRGRGIVVVSTSQGIMSGDEAKTKRLGGELICEVY